MSDAVRIAMWSGPRNISTAMMRAWENRGDCAVWDEPLYAYYLSATGIAHPGADAVMSAGETDWRRVVERAAGPVPGGRPVWFQKHMTQHLLEEVSRDWLDEVSNCFLIRDPREVIASYARTRPEVTLEDVGVIQQGRLYEALCERTGRAPVVIDSRDVLEAPEAMLRALCDALGVDFTKRMLSWAPGPRESDGVWAPHWYANVLDSTGFAPYTQRDRSLAEHLEPIAEACEETYRTLHARRLTAR